jgi:hypothetical protein
VVEADAPCLARGAAALPALHHEPVGRAAFLQAAVLQGAELEGAGTVTSAPTTQPWVRNQLVSRAAASSAVSSACAASPKPSQAAPVLGPEWLFLLLTPGPILGLAALLQLARERHSILGT